MMLTRTATLSAVRILRDDADSDGDLVGREDLLALNGELALAHVDLQDLHLRPAGPARLARKLVPAGLKNLVESTVHIPQASMGTAHNDVSAAGHDTPPSGGT
jgi:hypothetical protein